jgi:hypothetical protein
MTTTVNDIAAMEMRIRSARSAVEAAYDNTLYRAMEVGDVLLEIIRRGLIKHGQRKALFVRACGSNSTGQVYTRLARHRALLESNDQGPTRLSINAALRLITEKGT